MRLLVLAELLAVETVPLGDVVGCWLAADVVACRSQPSVDFSVMDGYAICFAELFGFFKCFRFCGSRVGFVMLR